MLELYYKFEELEMVKDSLYLALTEDELADYIQLEMKTEWERLRLKDCSDCFTADATRKFFSRMLQAQKKQQKRNRNFERRV